MGNHTEEIGHDIGIGLGGRKIRGVRYYDLALLFWMTRLLMSTHEKL
jgi:hypothetical protein